MGADEFRLAADQGLAAAQYDLAVAYYFGDGIYRDLSLAIEWYDKAAIQGHPNAQFILL